MLAKSTTDAIRALLELAAVPERWRTGRELAAAQQLPEPMLEQLLLRLRRAGLVVARRGRLGGYRLARPPAEICLAAVIGAMQTPAPPREPESAGSAAEQVTRALEQRLQRAVGRTLQELSLEELLFDLRSAEACRDGDAGLLLG
ncbi:Rrf2 family transcriptional regulator [Cyanobium sp. NIES-981]|uniref:Rrf2 family transcriptional regulator n=1 Tax=Cyanobium sp. NIES-981 TaxID=1851505 RepID=UPI0007DDDBD9|nr:Rrf2 family transcriptional regulator [Cyanobium sp. NIES-981]SBO42432.1 Rrf2 family protein [Cyanobium sp. NIES-981]